MNLLPVLILIPLIALLWWGSQVLILKGLFHIIVKEPTKWSPILRTVIWSNVILAIARYFFSFDTLDYHLLSIPIILSLLQLNFEISWGKKFALGFLLPLSSLLLFIAVLMAANAVIVGFKL